MPDISTTKAADDLKAALAKKAADDERAKQELIEKLVTAGVDPATAKRNVEAGGAPQPTLVEPPPAPNLDPNAPAPLSRRPGAQELTDLVTPRDPASPGALSLAGRPPSFPDKSKEFFQQQQVGGGGAAQGLPDLAAGVAPIAPSAADGFVYDQPPAPQPEAVPATAAAAKPAGGDISIERSPLLGEGLANMTEAAKLQAAAAQAGADQTAKILKDGRDIDEFEREAAETARVEVKQRIADTTKVFDTAVTDFDTTKVKGFWDNKSTGTKIFAALAMGMGAYGSAVTGTPNMAMQIINKAIDDDLATQRADIAKKGADVEKHRSTLASLRGELKDIGLAELAARKAAYEGAQVELQILKAKTSSETAIAQAQAMEGQLQVKVGEIDEQRNAKIAELEERRYESDAKDEITMIKALGLTGKDDRPANVRRQIAEVKSLDSAIEGVEKSYQAMTGKLSYFTQKLPNTDASRYNRLRKFLASRILKAIQGSRPSDYDLQVFMEFVPDAAASKETATFLFAQLRSMMLSTRKAMQDEFGASPEAAVDTDRSLAVQNKVLASFGISTPLRGPDADADDDPDDSFFTPEPTQANTSL